MALIQPDDKVLRAMSFMSNEQKVKPFLQWLYDSMIAESLANNKTADTEMMLRNAGANLRTEEIYSMIHKAHDTLTAKEKTITKDQVSKNAY